MNHWKIEKSLGVLVISMYLFLSLFSILILSGHMHGAGSLGQECPYSQGTHTLCTMDILEHLEAWKNMTRGTLVSFALLPLVFFFVLFAPRSISVRTGRKKRTEYYYRPYQELFSQGLLHPKAF